MIAEAEPRPCTLYRHFAADGSLLYVGITFEPPARRRQHAGDKPWWTEVATSTYSQMPDRDAALAAEREAIVAEHPRWNKIHNGAVAARRSPMQIETPADVAAIDRTWRVVSRTGFTRETPLWLEWHIDSAPMCQEYDSDDITARELFNQFVKRYYPDNGWAQIYWRIMPLMVRAPFQISQMHADRKVMPNRTDMRHAECVAGMLEDFFWPTDAATGERANFLALPIPDTSWSNPTLPSRLSGFVQEATGWKPGALEPFVNIGLLTADLPRGGVLAPTIDPVTEKIIDKASRMMAVLT